MSTPGDKAGQSPPRAPRGAGEPKPGRIRTAKEFRARLVELRERNDLTLDELNRRSEGRLPRTTLHNNLDRHKNTLPSRDFVERYLQACGLEEEAVARWITARETVQEKEKRKGPHPGQSTIFEALSGRWFPALIAVSVAVVLLVTVGAIVSWRHHQERQEEKQARIAEENRIRHAQCGTADPALKLDEDDGECIGVTDGAHLFNQPGNANNPGDRRVMERINEVQQKIHAENTQVVTENRPYVKVALVTPLTISTTRPSTTSLRSIQHGLEGAYTALRRANHSADFGDEAAVRLQLVLANRGSRQEAGDDFVNDVLAVSEPGHPLVAVVGLGTSVPTTQTIAEKFAAHGIPMVSAVAAADPLTGLKGLWSVSPSTTHYAQALRAFLDHRGNTALKSGIIVFDQNPDLYTDALTQAYNRELAPYLEFRAAQSFVGGTIGSPATPRVFEPVVTNLCTAANDPNTPLDMVFYAGRVEDFHAFAKVLSNRVCKKRPLAVLAGSTSFARAQESLTLLDEGNVTVIYATASDPTAWTTTPAGRPPDYPSFTKAHHHNGFLTGPDGHADLVDGYAIAHHDALAAAAKAIRLAAQGRPIPKPHDVATQFGQLSLAHRVRAATGRLSFPPGGGRATGRTVPIRQIGIKTKPLIRVPASLKPYKIP